MHRHGIALFCALCVTATMSLADDAAENLAEPLQPFAPLLGKTWKGEFKGSTPEKPIFDVARWERALNGKAVRVLHSVNDGAYGGETLIIWDAKRETLAYWYFTTADFRTEGTMKHEDGQIVALEKVDGGNAITEVKSTTKMVSNSEYQVKAEYLKDGKPSGGREVTYKLAPDAKVVFK